MMRKRTMYLDERGDNILVTGAVRANCEFREVRYIGLNVIRAVSVDVGMKKEREEVKR